MPNHYHILIQTPKGNLSRAMRHINGVYTQRFNRAHKYDGQLFRGRFKSVLVEEDSHLLQLIRYIHRNPLRAGICDDLKLYPWSSHHGYLTISKKWDWLFKSFILAMISRGESKGVLKYKSFINMEDSKQILDFYARKYLSPILGEEKFLEWIRSKYYELRTSQEISNKSGLEPETKLIKKIICKAYKVDSVYLLKVRRGFFNEPKFIAIYLTRMLTGLTLLEIGKEFDVEKYRTISSIVKKIEKKLEGDRELRCRLKDIKSKIIKCQIET